jgi:hypothetical protein
VRKVSALDQCHLESAHRRIPCRSGTCNASADDQEIELVSPEALERFFSRTK